MDELNIHQITQFHILFEVNRSWGNWPVTFYDKHFLLLFFVVELPPLLSPSRQDTPFPPNPCIRNQLDGHFHIFVFFVFRFHLDCPKRIRNKMIAQEVNRFYSAHISEFVEKLYAQCSRIQLENCLKYEIPSTFS